VLNINRNSVISTHGKLIWHYSEAFSFPYSAGLPAREPWLQEPLPQHRLPFSSQWKACNSHWLH